MNTFKNVDKVYSMMSDAEKISTLEERFNEATSPGNSGRIDKFKIGFNADDRFKAFNVPVYLSVYTGSYGSSSVGNFLSLTSHDEVKRAFIKFLNDNRGAVLKGIASNLKNEADQILLEAREELGKASATLDLIENSKFDPVAF